uniref:EGF-like domain-containing protein n=1 Tax=Odontella aurita TaxID=265563 RepID=A0A7S4HQM8_9STRA|mmetsp:Transcript_13563/g.39547  ORF Transcript_13563/g.39547 Transcript_13563/m.39547 type:complete len:404 (+) Transcript_13563:26-1237(+)
MPLTSIPRATFIFVVWRSVHNFSAVTHALPRRPPCSLNGALDDSGICICDAPWSGSDCSVMDFEPLSFPQGYGMTPNVTTWGGNFIFDGEAYHLYVSRMTNNCTLQAWVTNSRVDHAVSKNIEGPYTFKDVAINTWSHNPAVIALPDGGFAIFHIGGGNGDPNGGKNCTSNVEAVTESLLDVSALGRRNARTNEFRAVGVGSSIHVSESLDGPWTPLGTNSIPGCNNPSPFVHPTNRTIFVICNNDSLLRSNSITGPWTTVTQFQVEHLGGPPGIYEDAFLYIDLRGNFHSLWHAYNTTEHQPHGHECIDSTVSAHAYSKDGHDWFASPVQPYGTQSALLSGDFITVATRERPKLFFNGKGQMTHLINGVCGAPACPNGPRNGCVACKVAGFWDYTLIAPLKQ